MSLWHQDPGILAGGTLAEHHPVEILGLLHASRRTGVLTIRREGHDTMIYVLNGIPVNAFTGAPCEDMVEVMARDEVLSAEDMLRIRQLAREREMPSDECIHLVHELSAEQLQYYRTEAAKELIIRTCGYREGAYSFRESGEVMADIAMHDLNPLEIIYKGMARFPDADLDTVIRDLPHYAVKLNPDIHDYFLLPGNFYEHSHILDIFYREIPVAEAVLALKHEFKDNGNSVRLLYLLIASGMLLLVPEVPAEDIIEDLPSTAMRPVSSEEIISDDITDRDDEVPEVEEICLSEEEGAVPCEEEKPWDEFETLAPRGAISGPAPVPPQTPVRQPVPPAAPDPPPPPSSPYALVKGSREYIGPRPRAADPIPEPAAVPPPKPERRGPVLTLESLHAMRLAVAQLKKQLDEAKTIFDVLEVTLDDGAPVIKASYERKKKIVTLGEVRDELPRSLTEQADELGQRLDLAYQVLATPERRIDYERRQFEEENKRAWNIKSRKALARKMEHRGHWYLNHNAPQFARECFQHAINLDPEFGEYFMDLGWSIYRSHPEKAAEARGYINSALQIDPHLDMANYYLGIIAKREQNSAEAESYFRKALELNPQNSSAQRELAFHVQNQKQKGLWNKLFKA